MRYKERLSSYELYCNSYIKVSLKQSRNDCFICLFAAKKDPTQPQKEKSKMAAIAYDPENVFQKIIDGVIPSYKIFETEHVLAILDAFPLVPGHALLLPKAQYATVIGEGKASLH